MLGGGVEHPARLVLAIQPAPYGKVVALGAAGGKEHVFFIRVKRFCNGAARFRHIMLGVHGGRV